MKSRWPTILAAFLIPIILVGADFYMVRSCGGDVTKGTAVWVPHLDMCAAVVNEAANEYALDVDTVCGSEEGDCQNIYRSPVTGEPLVLPDFVNVNFTPNSYPVTISPDLKNLVYVERNEAEAVVHVYNLVSAEDHAVESFGFEVSSLFDFEWLGNDQFSFVTLDYDAVEPEDFVAERYLYEWHDEMWNLILKELVEGGEVSCNPVYCELK